MATNKTQKQKTQAPNKTQGKAHLQELVTAFIASAGAMRENGQKFLLGCLIFMYQHGDWKHIANLLDEVVRPDLKGVNRQLIINFLVNYGGLKIESGKGVIGWSGKKYIKDHMDEARANPWYEVDKVEKDFEGWDAKEQILKLLKSHKKAEELAKKQGRENLMSYNVPPSVVEGLLALINFEGEIITAEGDEEQEQEAA